MDFSPSVRSILTKLFFPSNQTNHGDMEQPNTRKNKYHDNELRTTDGKKIENYQSHKKKHSKDDISEVSYLPPLPSAGDCPNYVVTKKHGENTNKMQKHKRSSSLSNKKCPQRKRRTVSTLKKIEPFPTLKKTKSYNSAVKPLKFTSHLSKGNIVEDPVTGRWENKSAAVYTAFAADPSKPKPTGYWVKTELQYVVLLPKERPRGNRQTPRKEEKGNKPPDKPEREPSLTPTAVIDTTSTPTITPQSKRDRETFSNLGSDKGSFFESISDAKPAPKPKGRFCCFKRQDSG